MQSVLHSLKPTSVLNVELNMSFCFSQEIASRENDGIFLLSTGYGTAKTNKLSLGIFINFTMLFSHYIIFFQQPYKGVFFFLQR